MVTSGVHSKILDDRTASFRVIIHVFGNSRPSGKQVLYPTAKRSGCWTLWKVGWTGTNPCSSTSDETPSEVY